MAVTQKETKRRQKFIRNKARVDDIVFRALEKIRRTRGDVFKVGVDTILEHVDGRLASTPSRASVYRSVERLAAEGKIQIARKGERGNYTYSFGEIPSSVTVPTPVPVPATKTSETTAQDEVSSLIERKRMLSQKVDALLAQLRAEVAAEEQKAQTLESVLSQREAIPA